MLFSVLVRVCFILRIHEDELLNPCHHSKYPCTVPSTLKLLHLERGQRGQYLLSGLSARKKTYSPTGLMLGSVLHKTRKVTEGGGTEWVYLGFNLVVKLQFKISQLDPTPR